MGACYIDTFQAHQHSWNLQITYFLLQSGEAPLKRTHSSHELCLILFFCGLTLAHHNAYFGFLPILCPGEAAGAAGGRRTQLRRRKRMRPDWRKDQ